MASNPGDSWIKALLDSLQALHSKLSVLILNRRIDSYRKDSGHHLDKQILSTLYDIAENTPKPENLKTGAEDTRLVNQAGGMVPGDSNRAPGVKQSNAPPAIPHSDLSSHLHTNLSKTSDSGHLGEKLKASAWDHIHTSLRYVRQGKADLAKMYADLANEALQQASHHMTDDEYIVMKTSILEELQKLRER